jgi:signal transduction histidine kinase
MIQHLYRSFVGLAYAALILSGTIGLSDMYWAGQPWWIGAGLLAGLGVVYFRWLNNPHLYLIVQAALIIGLMTFRSAAFVIPCFAFIVHTVYLFPNRTGALVIASLALAISFVYQSSWLAGPPWTLLISTAFLFFGLLAYALRQAEVARHKNQALLDELQAAHRQLQAHTERIEELTVVEERQRLAREIHDTLAQGFTSIVMHLEAAEGVLPDEPATVRQHLDRARRTARGSLDQARRLVWALRPEYLERASLPEALTRVVAQWERESGIAAVMTTTGSAVPLPLQVEVALLRATQEALTNVRRHAQANQVTVTLSYMDDLIALDVQDDGVGFDFAQIHAPPVTETVGGFGLTAMRERVEGLGGALLVESAPNEGATLVIEIPLPTDEQAESLVSGIHEKWRE